MVPAGIHQVLLRHGPLARVHPGGGRAGRCPARIVPTPLRVLRWAGISQISHGLTGRHWTTASMPDTGQDLDVRIRIPAHWPDGRY